MFKRKVENLRRLEFLAEKISNKKKSSKDFTESEAAILFGMVDTIGVNIDQAVTYQDIEDGVNLALTETRKTNNIKISKFAKIKCINPEEEIPKHIVTAELKFSTDDSLIDFNLAV